MNIKSLATYCILIFTCFLSSNIVFSATDAWSRSGPFGGEFRQVISGKNNENILLASSTAGEVYRSVDAGASWDLSSTGIAGVRNLQFSFDPNDTTEQRIYAAGDGGFFISTDGGINWNASIAGLGSLRISSLLSVSIVGANSAIYIGTEDQSVFKSVDQGLTWAASSNGIENEHITAMRRSPVDPNLIYAGTNGGGMVKTTDAGANWIFINTGITNFSIISLDVYALLDTSQLYAGTQDGGLFESTDAGINWSPVSSLADRNITAVLIDDTIAPAIIYVGTSDNGVKRSLDTGVTWVNTNAGIAALGVSHLIFPEASNHNVLFASSTQGIDKTIDKGLTWTDTSLGLQAIETVNSNGGILFDPQNNNTLYNITVSGLYKSLDQGNSSNRVGGSSLQGAVLNSAAIDPVNNQRLYLATETQGILLSTDAGENWFNSNLNAMSVLDIEINLQNNNILYAAALENGVFKSINQGIDWSNSNTGLTGPINSVLVHPQNSQIVYASSLGAGIFESLDAGVTWNAINAGLTEFTIKALVFKKQDTDTTNVAFQPVLYAATTGGVFKRDITGIWNSANVGLSNLDVQSLLIDSSNSALMYAGTTTGVFISTDSAVSWSFLGGGFDNFEIRSLTQNKNNPRTLYAATAGFSTLTLEHSQTVNTPPTLQLPDSPQILQDFTFDFALATQGTGESTIKISDDAGINPVEISITAVDGTLNLTDLTGVNFFIGDGNADPILTFQVALAQADSTLASLQFLPTSGFLGSTNLNFIVNDLGNQGLGAAHVIQKSLLLDVVKDNQTLLNNAPVFANITPANGAVDTLFNLTISATDIENHSVTYSLLNALDGASIDATTGAFIWVPRRAGTFAINVRATETNGFPTNLSTDTSINILVEGNVLSVLNANSNTSTSGSISVWHGLSPELLDVSIAHIQINPVNPLNLYLGTPLGVLGSKNLGETWQIQNLGMGALDVRRLILDEAHPNVLYAATSAGVFRTEDNANTWIGLNQDLERFNLTVTDLIVLSKREAIDPDAPLNPDEPIVEAIIDTLYAALGNKSGIVTSDDAGTTWRSINTGLTDSTQTELPPSIHRLAIQTNNPNILFAASAEGLLFKTLNAGETWNQLGVGLTGANVKLLDISPVNSNLMFMSTDDGLFSSIDAGENWVLSQTGMEGLGINQMLIGQDLVAATSAGIYISKDVGIGDNAIQWTASNNGFDGAALPDVRALAIDLSVLQVIEQNPDNQTLPPPLTTRLFAGTQTQGAFIFETAGLLLQDYALKATDLQSFVANNISNLPAEIFIAFTAEHIQLLSVEAFSGFNAAQLANMTKAVIAAISVEQFISIPIFALAGLHENNIGGLNIDIIKLLNTIRINALNAARVRLSSDEDIMRIITNVDVTLISTTDLLLLLPENWTLNVVTGALITPTGTHLAFSVLQPAGLPDNLILPDNLPNLNSRLGLGGLGNGNTLQTELNNILRETLSALKFDDATINELSIQQTSQGIINVGGQFAFIVDVDNAQQGENSATTGISNAPTGRLLFITASGKKIFLIPAPRDPTELLNVLKTEYVAQGLNFGVQVNSGGDVLITFTDNSNRFNAAESMVVLNFDPVIEFAPDDAVIGLNIKPKGLLFVYNDRRAQKIYPAIPEPEQFKKLVEDFPFVISPVRFNINGSATVMITDNIPVTVTPQLNSSSVPASKGRRAKPVLQINPDLTASFTVQQGKRLITTNLLIELPNP